MFFKIIAKSFKMRKARYALTAVALMIGASMGSAMIMLYLDIDHKVQEEILKYGANLVVVPKTNLL